MTSAPPSIPREMALGRGDLQPRQMPASSALVTKLRYTPLFYWPEGHDDLKSYRTASEAAQLSVTTAVDHLHEARMLLSLLELNPTYRMAWVQAKDLSISEGMDLGWWSHQDGEVPSYDFVIESSHVELANAFFNIDTTTRRNVLHIPLDRLDRSLHEKDFADRAIDLGIALEALLLHEQRGDRGELKFRLGLRGAWLAGEDANERVEIQKTLAKVYQLRSDAVHAGKVEPSEPNAQTLKRGTVLCRRLVRKMIEAGGGVDWTALVLGGG
jgi:Apea-like HEPN